MAHYEKNEIYSIKSFREEFNAGQLCKSAENKHKNRDED